MSWGIARQAFKKMASCRRKNLQTILARRRQETARTKIAFTATRGSVVNATKDR